MKFFVSRQRYWGAEEEDSYIVEIASGGSDYANPDMMGVRWPLLGEGEEFTDPREAVSAAIKVCDAWKASGETNAKIAYGFTGGGTLPFDPVEYDDARKWAEEKYEQAPKCTECGGILNEKDTYTHDLAFNDEKFCREYCAEKAYQDQVKADQEACQES